MKGRCAEPSSFILPPSSFVLPLLRLNRRPFLHVHAFAVRPTAGGAEDTALPFLDAVAAGAGVGGLVVAAVGGVVLLVRRGRAFHGVVDAVVVTAAFRRHNAEPVQTPLPIDPHG